MGSRRLGLPERWLRIEAHRTKHAVVVRRVKQPVEARAGRRGPMAGGLAMPHRLFSENRRPGSSVAADPNLLQPTFHGHPALVWMPERRVVARREVGHWDVFGHQPKLSAVSSLPTIVST
jgi:hypothetical protein